MNRACKNCRYLMMTPEYADLCYGCSQARIAALEAEVGRLDAKARECKCDSCNEVFSSPEMYLSHRTCPVAAIAARDAVILELIDAGNASYGKLDIWEIAKDKALVLIGGEKGEQP